MPDAGQTLEVLTDGESRRIRNSALRADRSRLVRYNWLSFSALKSKAAFNLGRNYVSNRLKMYLPASGNMLIKEHSVTFRICARKIRSLSRNSKALFLGLAVLICGSGCLPFNQDEYVKTVESARTAIPAALQIESIFDEVDHTITHYGFWNEPTNQWNTTAYFGGRYRLHMTVDVEIDYANCEVRQVEHPEFRLYEYSRIYDASEGSEIYGGDVAGQIEFAAEDWRKVFENNGDFTVIGVTILHDRPLKDFDKFVAGCRRDIIPVRLDPHKGR